MGSLTITQLSLDMQLLYLTELELRIKALIDDIDVVPHSELNKKTRKSIAKLIGLEAKGLSLELLILAIDAAKKNTLSSEELVIKSIKRLELQSNRGEILFKKDDAKEALTYVIGKITNAKIQIIQEKKLIPYQETLNKAVKKDVKETSRLLTLIGIRTILLVHQKGLMDTKSDAYAVMRHYYDALHNFVQNDIKSQEKNERLIFWLEVLQEHHTTGDIHSVMAIYIAIDSLRDQLNASFNKLKADIKTTDALMVKKYHKLAVKPILLIKLYETNPVIVPYTGCYDSMLNFFKESNRQSQNIVNLFNFFTQHTDNAELEVIIKTYANKPEQATELLNKLIERIPQEKVEGFLPIIKPLIELRNDLQQEFTSAVLHKYRDNLVSLKQLEQLVKKEQHSIEANNETLVLMISTFEKNIKSTEQMWQSYTTDRSVRPILKSIDLAYMDESHITGHKNKKETPPASLRVPHSFFGSSKSRSYEPSSNPLKSDEAEASSSAPNHTPKSV